MYNKNSGLEVIKRSNGKFLLIITNYIQSHTPDIINCMNSCVLDYLVTVCKHRRTTIACAFTYIPIISLHNFFRREKEVKVFPFSYIFSVFNDGNYYLILHGVTSAIIVSLRQQDNAASMLSGDGNPGS